MKKMTNILLALFAINTIFVSSCLGATGGLIKKGYELFIIVPNQDGLLMSSINLDKNDECTFTNPKVSLDHLAKDAKGFENKIANFQAQIGLTLQSQFKATILTDKQQVLKLMETCQNSDSLKKMDQSKLAHFVLKEIPYYQIGNGSKYSKSGARIIEENENNNSSTTLVSSEF